MLRIYNHRYKKYVYELYIGEHMATREKGIMISTILGPCISVCLADKVNGVVGMNHFMMPGSSGTDDARYGFDCTTNLIREMVAKGAQPFCLSAKIFGGANVTSKKTNPLSESNIEFIYTFLRENRIPVVQSDTGSIFGRRIFFCSDTQEVHLKTLERSNRFFALPDAR